MPLRLSYPEKFRCPLLEYPTTFQDCRKTLNLSLVVAEILDDVRFLTISITACLLSPKLEPIKTSKIQSTAACKPPRRHPSILRRNFELIIYRAAQTNRGDSRNEYFFRYRHQGHNHGHNPPHGPSLHLSNQIPHAHVTYLSLHSPRPIVFESISRRTPELERDTRNLFLDFAGRNSE